MTSYAIIGADGMLARELALQLKKRGDSIVTIGRKPHNDIVFDLLFEQVLDSSCRHFHADVVFYCAAAFFGDDALGAKSNFAVNVMGILNALKLFEELGCKYCCYAGSVFSIPECDTNGMSSYGLSKAHAESIINWHLTKFGGRFSSLRFSQLYDTDGLCCHHQPWFGRIVAYASRGIDLRLPPSNSSRNYLHVSDAARLMIKAADVQLEGVWPVVNTEALTHTEIASMAYTEFDKGGKWIVDDSKTPFRAVNFPNDYQVYSVLNEQPAINMQLGLKLIHDNNTATNFGPMDVK